LEEHLSLLTRSSEMARSLGTAGRRAFEQNWSESTVMQRYFELIHSIAEGGRLPAKSGAAL
jgi:hypothetical protein